MDISVYEEYAQLETTHWWFRGRRAIFDALIRYLDIPEEALLLDVGCGTGVNFTVLASYGRVIGLDRAEVAVRYARAHTTVPTFVSTATALPFVSNSFDLITAFDLIEHIDDDAICAHELARVCRPGGFIMVTVPAFQWLWGRQDIISHHKRRYRSDQLAQLFTHQGLEIRRLTYMNTILFPAIAAVRLFRHSLPDCSGELHSDFSLLDLRWINTILGKVFGAEAWVLRRWCLPIGVSILCIARKPLYP
jgi:SAM-dependent methyltransferase